MHNGNHKHLLINITRNTFPIQGVQHSLTWSQHHQSSFCQVKWCTSQKACNEFSVCSSLWVDLFPAVESPASLLTYILVATSNMLGRKRKTQVKLSD